MNKPGAGGLNDVEALRPRLNQWREAFAKASDENDWPRFQELDLQLRPVLQWLGQRPECKTLLRTELDALQRQHAAALAQCRERLAQIEQNMQAFQREREGLQAYSQVSDVAENPW